MNQIIDELNIFGSLEPEEVIALRKDTNELLNSLRFNPINSISYPQNAQEVIEMIRSKCTDLWSRHLDVIEETANQRGIRRMYFSDYARPLFSQYFDAAYMSVKLAAEVIFQTPDGPIVLAEDTVIHFALNGNILTVEFTGGSRFPIREEYFPSNGFLIYSEVPERNIQ